MNPFQTAAAAILAAAALGWAPAALAQADADGLDKLLEKLDEKKAGDAKTDKAGDAKPGDAKPADEPKKGGVAPKDEEVDDLLKDLGETRDAPTAGGPAPKPEMDREKKADAVKPEDKPVDDELERILGRIRKKQKPPGGGGGGPPKGPLDEAIKKMRDVERRLARPDTGEDTRREQKQIVTELDQVLERLRVVQIKSQGQPKNQKPQKGQSPGSNPSNGAGSTPGLGQKGTTPPKKKPDMKRGPILVNKDVWGQLPGVDREDVNNTFKEEPLPKKYDMVKRYYESVAKKGVKKED